MKTLPNLARPPLNLRQGKKGDFDAKPSVVVLTRLAIDPASDSDLRQLEPGEQPLFLDPDWVAIRINQLQVFALRSLLLQSTIPTLHLIGVDERVQEQVAARLGPKLPRFSELLPLKTGQSFNQRVRDRLSELPNDQITIRLDSDDSLAPDFISKLVRHIKVGHAYNFPHGVQWIASQGTVVHRWILSNPNVAYRSVDGSHVFDWGRHRLVRERVPTANRWTVRPMYLKHSHSLNHAKYQPGGLSVLRPKTTLRSFGVDDHSELRDVRWAFFSFGPLLLFYFRRKLPKVDHFLYSAIKIVRRLVSQGRQSWSTNSD